MMENFATLLGRRLHVRGVDRTIRLLYPVHHDSHRYVRGVRRRRDGLQMELDSRTLIDWELLFHGEYEPELRLLFERFLQPGDVAIDVGANVGAHTLTLARLVGESGRVLAFEPNPPIYERLRRNIALNVLPQVSEYGCALGSDTARLSLRVPKADSQEASNPGIASLVALDTPHDLVEVEVRPLDDVVSQAGLTRIDIVKIDVQGYECNVLRGARATIERFRPAIIFEYENWAWQEAGASLAEAARMLPTTAYRYFRIEYRAALHLVPFDPGAPVPDHVNLIALPLTDGRLPRLLQAFG